MDEKLSRILAAAGVALVLAAVNFTVMSHERTLSEGRVMLLPLAPVDPRSLMQGDYMALRFAIANSVPRMQTESPQRMVVRIGADNVATYSRAYEPIEPLAPDEALLEYRMRNGQVRIVTDAYFFQEGHAGDFSRARFGELRVRPDGQALLVGLRDEAKAPLGAPR
jgi:uncharacterized membrane-anchored protein